MIKTDHSMTWKKVLVSKNFFWNDQDLLHAPDIISTSMYTMVSKT